MVVASASVSVVCCWWVVSYARAATYFTFLLFPPRNGGAFTNGQRIDRQMNKTFKYCDVSDPIFLTAAFLFLESRVA